MSSPASSEPSGTRELWAVGGRCIALGVVLGFSLVMAAELTFSSGWVSGYFADNGLEMPRRSTMLVRLISGAGLGGLIAAFLLWRGFVRETSLARVERRFWLVSPLIALPLVPVVAAVDSWRDRHESLLPVVLLGYGIIEVLAVRAMLAAPPALGDGVRWFSGRIPPFWRRHGPTFIVTAAAAFYSVFMSFYMLRWHQKLRTANFDLSIANNLIYSAMKGRPMSSTVAFYEDPDAYMGAHANFGQFVILPIYALLPRAETLLVIQSVLLGFGALPLYAFARRHVSRLAAAAVAIAYLLYYPLHSANFSEVKYSTIACFFIFLTLWAVDARRWVIFFLSFPCALIMREDVPIGLAVAGAFLFVSGYRPKVGLFMALVSTVWFAVLRFYIMEKAGDWWFPSMYQKLFAPGAGGFQSVIKTLITNPFYVLPTIYEERKLYYILHLLVPIAFLPARRWYLWAAFIPGAIVTLLATDYKPPTMFSFQYVMFWIPYLFVGATLALRAISRQADIGPIKARAALVAMLFASAALSYNYGAFAARDGSLRGGYKKIEFAFSAEEAQRYANLKEIIRIIPKDATVAATEYVGPHVSSRLVLYSARYGPRDAEYVLASSLELDLKKTKPMLLEALDKNEYGVIKRIDDFAVLRRGADTSGNEDLIEDWGLRD